MRTHLLGRNSYTAILEEGEDTLRINARLERGRVEVSFPIIITLEDSEGPPQQFLGKSFSSLQKSTIRFTVHRALHISCTDDQVKLLPPQAQMGFDGNPKSPQT